MWSTNLNTSINSDGGFLNNTRKDGQGGNVQRVQTLIPVTIKLLHSISPIEDPTFWGIKARMFTFVGLIRNVEETATKISYDIEDDTGTITALKWLEANKQETDRVAEVNTYVRIVGMLREQNDKRHILILRLLPLQNLNELTNHILEVIYASLKAEAKLNKNRKLKKNTTNDVSNEDDLHYGMSSQQSLVYKIIYAQNDTECGIERSEIKKKVPKSILSDVDNIIEFLVSEGHIYTTSTDDHFKTT
ncbi:replication protein A 32 kDa subunit [Apis cerana]|uniref:Replication protein A n=1 Tax=Apis cerana cerana TaxID=94128 RepID=A0A2A3EG87_APICC|nr:replication protein A 32 kDa subunit [Apis cerana]PBC30775.1 Replication protein A [Apis cerana cerana]